MERSDISGCLGRLFNDDTDCSRQRYATLLFTVLFFTVGLLTCVRFGPADMPLLIDNQHYFFIAERAASGIAPHISQFDPKHALSMLLSGLAIRGGRLFAAPDVMSARWLSICITSASLSLLWLLAYRVTRRRLAGHLSVLAMLSFQRFFMMGTMGCRPKVFLVFFLLLAVLAMVDERPFLAGLSGALAFLCWQPALLVVVAMVPVLVLSRDRWRWLGLFLAGLLLSNLAYEAYFYWHGALAEQIFQSYVFPARYMTHGGWRLATHGTWIFNLKYGVQAKSLVPLAFALSLLLFWILVLGRPRVFSSWLGCHPAWLCIVLCAHAALLFPLYDYQGYPDRFLVEPFMALATGILFALPVMLLRAERLRRMRGALATAAILSLGAIVLETAPAPVHYRQTLAAQLARADRVGQLLAKGRSVYSVGSTHLLALNHVSNYIKYGLYFRGMKTFLSEQTHGRRFLPMRDGKLPDVMLLARGGIPGMQSWLHRLYRPLSLPPFDEGRVWELRRRTVARTR